VVDAGLLTARPKVVVTSSETLLDGQREIIAAAFQSPVAGFYSSAEKAAHILECELGGYHVLTDACVVEIVRTDGSQASAGEEGELVCTGMLDNLMPLIRYRTGDTGILAPGRCRCGRPGPVLSAINGRIEDVVLTPDGRRVGRLDHAFKDALRVKEAQLVQDRPDRLVVRLVPRPGYGPEDESMILAELRLRLGPSLDIVFETVEAVPRERNGKLKFVVSTVREAG
jgi:phenylacetate-CoA ligase